MVGTMESDPESNSTVGVEKATAKPFPLTWKFLTNEFQKRYLTPVVDDTRLHARSQWYPWKPMNYVYLVHRSAWMVFWVAVLVYVLIMAGDQFWYVSAFLTQWAYATIAVGTVFRFTLAVHHTFANSKPPKLLCNIDSLLYSAYNSISLLVSIGYWGFIHMNSQNKLDFGNITVHGLNSLYVLTDLWLSAYPVRLLMAWCPMAYLLMYAFANAVYWWVTGDSIYSHYTDWNKHPEVPIMWFSITIFLFIPGLHVLTFIMYWCRTVLFCKWSECYDDFSRRPTSSRETNELEPLEDISAGVIEGKPPENSGDQEKESLSPSSQDVATCSV